jgi:glutaminyl-tRNA synthetase
MPTIVGLRRRGYTPESIQLFCERIGVSKADGWIDMSTLEGSLRDDLDPKAPRAIAVLRPLKLIVDNFPEGERSRVQRPGPPAPSGNGRAHLPVHEGTVDRAGRLHGSPDQGLPPLHPPIDDKPGAACA